MAVTYGFYSSTNGGPKIPDQFGSLFRGIITDGIFLNACNPEVSGWTETMLPRDRS